MMIIKSQWRAAAKFTSAVAMATLVMMAILLMLAPLIWGVKIGAVESGSMSPTIPEGSLIVIKPVDPESIRLGQVISYHPPGSPRTTVTHRVAEIVRDGRGRVSFRTRGDANTDLDRYVVPGSNLVGRVRMDVPYIGSFAQGLGSRGAFIALIILPALALTGMELRRLARKHKQTRSPIGEPSRATMVEGGLEPR